MNHEDGIKLLGRIHHLWQQDEILDEQFVILLRLVANEVDDK